MYLTSCMENHSRDKTHLASLTSSDSNQTKYINKSEEFPRRKTGKKIQNTEIIYHNF